MARARQLAAVVIALVLVVSAAGYGIARGLTAEDTVPKYSVCRPPPPPPEECGWTCYSRVPVECLPNECQVGDAAWIPVINQVTLPSQLPQGVRLDTACYRDGVISLEYHNEQRSKFVDVGILNTEDLDSEPPEGVPTQLGNLVAYKNDARQADGTGFYDIRFEKSNWLYVVAAQFAAGNRVTAEELDAVALSMAER